VSGDALELLRARGVLSPLDEHFARTVVRLAGERDDRVLLAVALASRQVAAGHVCLDLPALAREALVDDAGEPVAPAWPPLADWLAALRRSPCVAADFGVRREAPLSPDPERRFTPHSRLEAERPLVLDPAGRLYLQRYWQHERDLASGLLARVHAPVEDPVPADLLLALFPPEQEGPAQRELFAPRPPDWQRVAAIAALESRFCVISGGPGTGKTHTVAKILALLLEQAARAGRRAPRILLLAPTGKAAARLKESIQARLEELPVSAATRAAIPTEAATIHRCLGRRAGSRTRFRHDRDDPLRADVVLVDESSMVDLALLARLVDALPPMARLILLGDEDQLASVEAGAVLADLCNTGERRLHSAAFAARVAALTADRIPHAADESSSDAGALPRSAGEESRAAGTAALQIGSADAGALPRGAGEESRAAGTAALRIGSAGGGAAARGLADAVVRLVKSWRYREGSAIGALARAINAGDADAALAVLAAGGAVSLVETGGAAGRAALLALAARGFAPYLRETEPAAQLELLEQFRVLCAHRRGPDGAETVNREIERELERRGLLDAAGGEAYLRRPLLVTRNDPQTGLFNGDVGVIGERADASPESGIRRAAHFPAAGGRTRAFPLARLPEHETVFAMTIHKSQGSEFDHVAVVLPAAPSPVLSRELLYTAVSRAREHVTVYASREIVRHAIARRVERRSGLRERLWPAT